MARFTVSMTTQKSGQKSPACTILHVDQENACDNMRVIGYVETMTKLCRIVNTTCAQDGSTQPGPWVRSVKRGTPVPALASRSKISFAERRDVDPAAIGLDDVITKPR